EGMQLAKSENKTVMIYFYSDSCGWCRKMEQTTFADERVVEMSKNFVTISVNAGNPWVRAQYHIQGVPLIVFTDSQGKEIYRINGYRDADAFLEEMDSVLRGFPRKTPGFGVLSGIISIIIWRKILKWK
ncbi:MAG: thioredoxin family protein, partial [Candidatus Syntropharchaeia archaeon]